ncbi:MAG: hypothetical protein WCJ33_02710 [Pseudomonadota bacterium]
MEGFENMVEENQTETVATEPEADVATKGTQKPKTTMKQRLTTGLSATVIAFASYFSIVPKTADNPRTLPQPDQTKLVDKQVISEKSQEAIFAQARESVLQRVDKNDPFSSLRPYDFAATSLYSKLPPTFGGTISFSASANDMINKVANQLQADLGSSIDWHHYVATIAERESGGNVNAVNKASQEQVLAKGLFQNTNTRENATAALQVSRMTQDTKDNYNAWISKFGTNPTEADLALLHQQGQENGLKLADPRNSAIPAYEIVGIDAVRYNVVKKLTEEQKRQGLSESPTVAEAKAISAGEFANYVRGFYNGNSYTFVQRPPSQVTVTPIEQPHLAKPPSNLQQNPPLKNIGEPTKPDKMDKTQGVPNIIYKENPPTMTPSPTPIPSNVIPQTQKTPTNFKAPTPKVEPNTLKDKSLEITNDSADIGSIKPDTIGLAGRNNKSLKNFTRH